MWYTKPRLVRNDDDNVIHVAFGKNGARRERGAPLPPGGAGRPTVPPASSPPVDAAPQASAPSLPAALAPSEPPPPTAPRSKGDPLAELYRAADVAKLFGVPESRLRYWDRTGLLRPSARAGRRRLYTFQDLIGLRAAKGLIDRGVPAHGVRRSIEALRRSLPKVARPLAELRVVADGQTLVVRGEGAPFVASTGQLVLDFEVRELADDVVRVLRRQPSENARSAAYKHYLEGCRLDEDEATFDDAEAAYKRAIEADPTLSNAVTNLGNLRYRQGHIDDAERYYEEALRVDARQPEAWYNLGFLHFERGDHRRAAASFRSAIELDPGFADAHFNLAMTYEAVGLPAEAVPHWRTYLRLDPTGDWADVARRHLGE